ncbi:MAG TPA: hypothetical protein VIF62_22680 [Labilithrix sp.]|jgi:hypothetical protein
MKNHFLIRVFLMCIVVGAVLGGVGAINHGHPVVGSSLLGVGVLGVALAWRSFVPPRVE